MKKSLMEDIRDPARWREFLEYKGEKGRLSREEEAFFRSFTEEERYLAFDPLELPYPEKRCVNKAGSGKKRVIYTFPADVSAVLKLMAYLLYRYDEKAPENCYAFRRGKGAGAAIRAMRRAGAGAYACKLDIHNYFNSIDVEPLLVKLHGLLGEDAALYAFLERLLRAGKAYEEGLLITEKRGVMAGIPIAPFLANVYLYDLDREFLEMGVPYARYSDDILFFAESREGAQTLLGEVEAGLQRRGLALNPEKTCISAPGEAWSYLGFSCCANRVDLSPATIMKIKGKIRRKARALYRWRMRKGATAEQAVRALVRIFDHKFFGDGSDGSLSWCRWFFPLLTTDAGLGTVDAYLQQYLRYQFSGRHGKQNYSLDYAFLKSCGYRPLVSAYYAYRAGGSAAPPAVEDGGEGNGNQV